MRHALRCALRARACFLRVALQEVAFQRLHSWVQQKFSPGDVIDLDAVGAGLLTAALRALRERPSFLRHCQDTISASRRTGLARRCAPRASCAAV